MKAKTHAHTNKECYKYLHINASIVCCQSYPRTSKNGQTKTTNN